MEETCDGGYPSMDDILSRGKMTSERRGPLREDDFWRKTIFEGRHPLREYEIWGKKTFKRKMAFEGRRPLRESYLWGKISFEGRWALKKGELWGNITVEKRKHYREDNLWWNNIFDGIQPLIKTSFGWIFALIEDKLRSRNFWCYLDQWEHKIFWSRDQYWTNKNTE